MVKKLFVSVTSFVVMFLLSLILILSFRTITTDMQPAEAATTITTKAQLSSAIRGGSGSYILGNNISWTSCGRNEDKTFSGTLDGNGHTITLNTGYTSRTTTGDNKSIGLMVSKVSGTIKNCTIVLADHPYLYEYTGSSSNYTNYCGIVCGTLNGSARIENVHIKVNGSLSYYAEDTSSGKNGGYGIVLGGFAGNSASGAQIKYSSVTVNGAIHGKAEDYDGNNDEGTKSRAHTGGFVGESAGSLTLTNCALYGSTNGLIGSAAIKSDSSHKSDRAGGVIGVVRSGSTATINGFLFDYNGGVTVYRTNDDCGLFVGKVYGTLSASNIVKGSACAGFAFDNDENSRQVTKRADVYTGVDILQSAGAVINTASVGNGTGTFSNTVLYQNNAYKGSYNSSHGSFKITSINSSGYTATLTAGSSYTPSAIRYGSTYSNCYSNHPTKGSAYTVSGISKASTSYIGYVATPSYSLTASYSNKTYDGSGGTFTVYPGSANAAFTNNVYLHTSGTPGNTISSKNSNTVTTNKNTGTYTCKLTNSSGTQLANNTLLYANATNAPSSVCYYNSQTYSLTINKRTASLNWTNTSFTYDGAAHKPTATLSNLVSGDSCTVTVSNTGTNAGTYTATASALSNSNYQLPAANTRSFVINQRPVTLTWSNTEFTYDKTSHLPTATAGNLVSGTTCGVTVEGAQINAGTHTATATSVSNSNYTLPASPTGSFTIHPKIIGLAWANTSFTYDGQPHCPTASATGLCSGDTCQITTIGAQTNADTYTSTASALSNPNYALPASKTTSFTIHPKTASLSWSNTSIVYCKASVKPTANVSNLVTGDSCVVSVTGEQIYVGNYTSTATALSNTNYALPADPSYGYEITPFTVGLTWSNTSPTYNGSNLLPIATANNLFAGDTCVITVTGAQSQAATGYTATAIATSNANYQLPEAVTTTWSILPKSLPVSYWQSSIEDAYTFTGARIYPDPVVTDDTLGLLIKDRDYTVSYEQNYSVTTGGTVFVEGINNYQSETSVSFTITKAPHNLFFTSLRHQNDKVGIETLEPDHTDFEVPFIASLGYQGNYITLCAYTDAVYSETFSASANPDISTMTAKQLLFTTSSGVVIEYVSNELVEINNAYYSKTTAKMYLSNSADIVQYGITAVTVGAEDNINYDSEVLYPMATRIVEDGYVEDFGGNDPTPLIHRIFIKKNHTASGSFLADITKTYGDEVFDITAGLNSGLLDYTVTCDNTDILSLTGSGVSRAATIKNAGTVTLTLFHPGITNLESPLNSYISVRAEITLTVEKAILSIVPVNKTTVYGTTVSYADIAASFLFGGFCYTDDFDIISSVASNYDPLIMRDVDSYPLKASDAVLNTTYQNYDIVYPENIATLTVTPKTLYAFIDDAEKEYGQENPVLDVSYTGFVYDETQTTAAELVAPVVNFNGVNSLTPVGQYIIGLNGGSAHNYTIDVSDIARLTISSAFVTIQLEEKTADYNAKSIYCNAPEIVGVQGGTTPTGTAAVYYLWGEDYSEIAPVDAGSYGVKIVYTSGPNDNYKDTVREISCAITVLPIDPLFVLEEITVDYNAAEYDGVPAAASVEAGVAGGTSPIGTLSFFYSREGGEFTQSLPKDSGAYTVRVVYHLPQGATDNYKDGTFYDFEQGLIIEKIDVSIDLEKAVSTYASSDKLTPDRLSANQAVAHGVFTEYTLDSERYPHTFSYKYLIDGEWVSEAPFNAGYYDVEVSFTALGDLNYRDTVAVFEQAIEILRATPSLSLEPKAVSYTGKRIAQNPAIATGIEGGSVPQGGFEYLFAPHGGAYGLFSRDYPVVNVNLTDGVNEGYDIIVRYLAAENDNYANNEQRFDQALTVLPVNPRILFSPSMANFSGSAFDISKIIASASGISGGSLPLGNLSYEFMTDDGWSPDAPVNSGSYSVKVTFTPATESTNGTHANYMTASGVFVDGIIINKVSPIITINPVKSDYTGSRVTLSLDNNEVHIAGVSPAYPPAGSLKIQYALAEDEWSDDGPTESGIYKIRIVYTATESENYTDVTKIFNNAITIYNIAPVFVPLTQETLIFSGERAAVTFEPQIVGNPGKGSLILNYKVGNSWTSRAPSDAGIYDVRINYIATIKDNYKSYMQAYPSVLVILPKEVNIAPLPNQNKVFDNMPVDTIEYMVSGLVAHDTLTGSLTIGQAVDAGAYTIEQGTLQVSTNGRPQNYQNNYRLLFTEGVLFEILPAEAEVTFGEISESLLVYRPYDNKEQYISVNAQYQGANIPVEIDIIGDDTYVGSFFVEVTICDNNYYISPENSTKEYTITPAEMPQEDIIFENAVYSYTGIPRLFQTTRIYDGATVTYRFGEESSIFPFEFTGTGEYTVTAEVSKANYQSVSVSAIIKIVKAIPIVSVLPYEGNLVFGDPLPTIECNNPDGEVSLDANQELIPGAYDYSWTFVPSDAVNYEQVKGTLQLTVNKAATSIQFEGEVRQSVSNPQKFNAEVQAKTGIPQGDITYSYFDSRGNEYSALPTKGGKYTIVVSYSGNEYYAASTYSTVITVDEPTSYKWVFVLLGALATLGILGGIIGAARKRR